MTQPSAAPTRFYAGYSEVRERVLKYELPELLRLIDDLFGRDNLRYGDDVEAVRAEALRQLEREWTNPEWEREWGPFIRAASARKP